VSLYPTKTRLALLRQVANSQVATGDDGHEVFAWPDAPTSWQDRVKVTARMDELVRAGWVTTDEADGPGVWWLLTDDGRKILEDNRG